MLALDTESAETQDEAEEVTANESEPASTNSVTTTEVLTATEGADAGHHPTIALSGAGSESDETGHQRTEVLQPDATAHTDAQHTQVIAHDRSADDRGESVDDSPDR